MSTATIRPRHKPQRSLLDEMPEFMTVKQAAQVLGISQSTYYEAIKRETVPFVRITPGRVKVPRERMRRWFTGQYQTPAEVRAARAEVVGLPLRIAR